MKIMKYSLRIKMSFIIMISLIILVIFFSFLTFKTDSQPLSSISGGLAAGLIVAIVQFLIAWQDYQETEKLKELELIKVLYTRSDRTFYENYIRKSKKSIDMMGVTGIRFFKDFADVDPNATSNAKVLLDALERNVKVRILLPQKNYIDNIKSEDVENVRLIVSSIKERYSNYQLEVRYFDHVPTHSIFNVDDESIVGPVFPELESKYTPALFLRSSSPIAVKYSNYFELEWNKGI